MGKIPAVDRLLGTEVYDDWGPELRPALWGQGLSLQEVRDREAEAAVQGTPCP